MKELKELKLEELSVEQKLGMTTIAYTWDATKSPKEWLDYQEELIRNHSLGAIWVIPRKDGTSDKVIQRLKDAADYPLLVITDAEAGLFGYNIGRHNALGITDSEELAYSFGKVTAAVAAKHGYNVVCNPVLDMCTKNSVCGTTIRGMGGDKYRVTELAIAETQGMHEGGCLTVGKHYPGLARQTEEERIDSHMAETFSDATAEELLEYSLYPYVELDKRGLLDGVMLGHARFPKIDPDFPVSLSKYGIQVLRDQGFNGVAVTDALTMMGVVAKYGYKNGLGYAIGNAGALALPWQEDHAKVMQWARDCYAEGIITDEVLDVAVQRVLDMQHKVLSLPQGVEPTDKEYADLARINTDSVYARVDEGMNVALDKNGKYYFAILTEAGTPADVKVDTFKGKWYNPVKIKERLEKEFPNAKAKLLSEFPTGNESMAFLNDSVGYETVFVTFCISQAYVGVEQFAPRIISLMEAMQVSDRISTVMHFGNPFLLQDLPHIPRVVVGTTANSAADAAIDVLTGKYPAKGTLTYDIKFK